MRKLSLVLIAIMTCVGCVSATVPKYLDAKVPYKRKFYTDFNNALVVTRQALTNLGWEINEESDPSIYELSFESDGSEGSQIILFTEIRQTPLFLGTRYAKLNVLLKGLSDGATEVEIRYLTINSLTFRNIESYNNESAVKRIFDHIAELIG